MAKYSVDISRVEKYKMRVVVEAETEQEALEKVEQEYLEEDYLYDHLTAVWDDADTTFYFVGPATEQEQKYSINID